MRNMKLRLISAALATCMMASVLPASSVTAFADDVNDNTSVTTPAEDPMGKLIENDATKYAIIIREPGTYQMSGDYTAPILVRATGDVVINITGDVSYEASAYTTSMMGPGAYAIQAQNPKGTLTINSNSTFTLKGGVDSQVQIGAVRALAPTDKNYDGTIVLGPGHVIVNGGTYISGENNKGKELFYNYQGEMELKNVTAKGEVVVKNNGGTTTIDGGSFERTRQTWKNESFQAAIINTVDGKLTLKNVSVSAEQGSALLNQGGTNTIIGGTFTTKDENYSAILANTNKDAAVGDGASKESADITIDGATIKNSNRGLEVKDGNITLKDATFENNGSDICLSENQKLEDVVDTTDYSGTKFTVAKTDESGKSEQYTMASLNVEGAVVTVDGKEAARNGDTVSVTIAEKTPVTIAYDEAAYKDSNLKFSGWTIEGLANAEDYKNQQTFTFEMPADTVTIKAGTATADTEDDSWDAATVVTGVAIGAGAAVLTYHIGTELYAEQVLGKGVAVPKNREDVALKAWELAGKPAVAIDGEPLSEAAQAEKWAVESGLMQNDAEGNFNGTKKMNKLKALRVLDKAQKMG